ncbi:hypothetical protein LTR56_017376 [Elasticomyces elasticus]|nr:hypothetical protein LTR56_017376 [Elasticomyces elasticus]KAK3639060.1 hypothetical protein LTR22_017588 [Elasticomyces elasticus]KAK4915641.1 hypothetical protein LTR49_016243 [Elasticomyces elasticus]KAK5752627.1 hypothetical protein LTS12_017290 [Elasticomyces elasticus]
MSDPAQLSWTMAITVLRSLLLETVWSIWNTLRWPTSTKPSLEIAVSVFLFSFLSLPLAAFAIFTTTLAFWVLLFRVSLVYAELLIALLRSYVVPPTEDLRVDIPSPNSAKDRSPRSRRASSSSGSSGLQMQAFGTSDSSTNLAEPLPSRDYEGVGGWREQEDDAEEALWLGINRPIEPPTLSGPRHYALGLTSLSRNHSALTSPEQGRSPLALRTSGYSRGSGTASPEGYFSTPLRRLSTTGDRTSKVSFEDQVPSTIGSTASLSSVKFTRQDPT